MMTLFSQLTDQQLCLVLEELSAVWSRVGREAFEDRLYRKRCTTLTPVVATSPPCFDVAGDYAENKEAA